MPAPLRQNARVLLIRLSALGDVLFALETLASLKRERPDVAVDFLVEDRFAGVLQGHPQIERVLVFPRRHKLAVLGALLRLRATAYDAVLDLHGNLKSALQVAFSRSPAKLGFAPPAAREGAWRVYTRAVTLPVPLPHRADRGHALLRELGLSGAPAAPLLPAPAQPVQVWPASQAPRVALHPGTSAFAPFKRWPVANFAALAQRLGAAGWAVGVSFGPGEEALFAAIAALAPGVLPIPGKELGLLGLAAAYRQARVVVAADTGPLHLAAAAGTRVVALFGPKDPALYGPRGPGHRVLWHETPCRPCGLRNCPAPVCVLGIGVDEVAEAVRAE